MASVNPYVLQGNVGIELQRKMEDTMASVQMLGIQEMRRREDAFVKMMDVETVNLVKDKASAQQLKDLDTYNQEAAKIAIASNYNPTPQERLKLNNLKRNFMQSQQSLLSYQKAWMEDREKIAMDKGQSLDMEMGMAAINEWDGISPYAKGQALTLIPKKRISDIVSDVLDETFPFNKSASKFRVDKKADGSYTEVTEHSRVGLHTIGPDGRATVDPEAKAKAYSILKSDKDIQYATSYLLAKETSAKAEEIMLTQKVPKAKAMDMAQEVMVKKWKATSVEDMKDQYLKFYTEDLLQPQVTDAAKVQGKGSNFNFFGPGGKGGYEFGWSPDSKTVSLRKGNGKTTLGAQEIGISNYKGDVPFEVVSFTPTSIKGKSFKYTEPDLTAEGVDDEKQAARKYPSGYTKAENGKFYPLTQGAEVVYDVPATKEKIRLLGDAFVKVYQEKFAGVEGNVFEQKSSKSKNIKTTSSSTGLGKWDKYTR